MVKCDVAVHLFTLMNGYLPNHGQVPSLLSVLCLLTHWAVKVIILGGDINMVLDQATDTNKSQIALSAINKLKP